jgi:hypothetical protein
MEELWNEVSRVNHVKLVVMQAVLPCLRQSTEIDCQLGAIFLGEEEAKSGSGRRWLTVEEKPVPGSPKFDGERYGENRPVTALAGRPHSFIIN